MQLKIIDKKEQKLLSRLEVKAQIGFSGEATPSGDKVKQEVAKAVGKDVKLVVLKNIYTNFGEACAEVFAYVYDDAKKLDELEITHKKSKNGEKKTSESKEEVKAEEKK